MYNVSREAGSVAPENGERRGQNAVKQGGDTHNDTCRDRHEPPVRISSITSGNSILHNAWLRGSLGSGPAAPVMAAGWLACAAHTPRGASQIAFRAFGCPPPGLSGCMIPAYFISPPKVSKGCVCSQRNRRGRSARALSALYNAFRDNSDLNIAIAVVLKPKSAL